MRKTSDSLCILHAALLQQILSARRNTLHHTSGARSELLLDLAQLPPALDLELRLSRLTRWVLECEQRALPYAFRLGAEGFDAGLGAAHQAACLRALALYGDAGAHKGTP